MIKYNVMKLFLIIEIIIPKKLHIGIHKILKRPIQFTYSTSDYPFCNDLNFHYCPMIHRKFEIKLRDARNVT